MIIIQVISWPRCLRKLKKPLQLSFHNYNHAIVADNQFMTDMSDALRKAALEALVPGLNEMQMVTVSFDAGHAHSAQPLNDDTTCCLVVSALFDIPERTKEHRDRLANSLKDAAKRLLPSEWKVEVVITRFNPEIESFVSG